MATKDTKIGTRPTGMDVAEYKNFRDWSYKRWAWEFLRRNPEFKKACIAAGDDLERQAQVASDFHLKKFKRHTHAFSQGGAPSFLSSAVTSWTAPTLKEPLRPRVTLRAGQVLVRFDLSVTTDDQEAIEAQLRNAATVIRKRQRTYLAEMGLPEPARSSARPTYFVRALRLLDLIDGKLRMSPGRALSIVNATKTSNMLPAEALDKCGHQVAAARELCMQGYRHLANRSGAPNISKAVGAN